MTMMNAKGALGVPWSAVLGLVLAVLAGAVGYGELKAQDRTQDQRLDQHNERLKAVETAVREQTGTLERLDERSINTERAIKQTLGAIEHVRDRLEDRDN